MLTAAAVVHVDDDDDKHWRHKQRVSCDVLQDDRFCAVYTSKATDLGCLQAGRRTLQEDAFAHHRSLRRHAQLHHPLPVDLACGRGGKPCTSTSVVRGRHHRVWTVVYPLHTESWPPTPDRPAWRA
eukprot:scaffold663_cov358-Prasinococcus_capsulatus_cf.AAC.5